MRRLTATTVLIGTALGALSVAAQNPADDAQVRALKVLRDTILQQERRGAAAVTNPPAPKLPTVEELERMYLTGKLTARQFQQLVQDYKLARAKSVSATNQSARPRAVVPAAPTTPPATNAPATTTNAPAAVVSDSEDLAAQNRLAELEAKMDELLRQRTNRAEGPTNGAPPGPKTKRERMDDLLRLLIAGKISQEDYNARRAKIMAEPDSDKK